MQRVAVLERHHLRDSERLPRVLEFEHNLATLKVMQDLLHTLQTPDQIQPEKTPMSSTGSAVRVVSHNRKAVHSPINAGFIRTLISCIRVPFPVSDSDSQAAPWLSQ
jgi:hypothetical protein